jgi:hypothetical protein
LRVRVVRNQEEQIDLCIRERLPQARRVEAYCCSLSRIQPGDKKVGPNMGVRLFTRSGGGLSLSPRPETERKRLDAVALFISERAALWYLGNAGGILEPKRIPIRDFADLHHRTIRFAATERQSANVLEWPTRRSHRQGISEIDTDLASGRVVYPDAVIHSALGDEARKGRTFRMDFAAEMPADDPMLGLRRCRRRQSSHNSAFAEARGVARIHRVAIEVELYGEQAARSLAAHLLKKLR